MVLMSGAIACSGVQVTPYSERAGTSARAVPTATLDDEHRVRPPGAALAGSLGDPEKVLRGRYTRWRFEADSTADNLQPGGRVRGLYYQSALSGPKPIVVVLPIWGKSSYPPRATTRRLLRGAAAGEVHVLRLFGEVALHDWEALGRQESEAAALAEVDRWAEAMATNARDIQGVFGWAATRPEVDARRIGLVGFSIGALVGALAYGLEPPPGAAVFALGGTDLATILSTCDDVGVRGRREIRQRLGWSLDAFRRAIEPVVARVSPIHYLAGIDPASVLVIDAARDACIPRNERERFWNALGRPERVTVDAGHNSFFRSMTPLGRHETTRRITAFLHRKLVEEPVPAGGRVAGAADAAALLTRSAHPAV